MRNLKHLDRLGFSYTLTTFGQEKFQSWLGACLTLIAATTGAFIFFFLGNDFLNKKNPIVIKNDKVHENSPFVNLSKELLPFMVSLKFADGFNLPDKPYKLLVEYIDLKINQDSTWETVCASYFENTTPCIETPLKNHPLYLDQDIESWMCVDIGKIEAQCRAKTKNDKYQIELGGVQGDKVIKYFRISVVNFNLTAERKKVNFASDEELISKTDIHFQIRFPKYYFDNELSENAFKTVYDQEMHAILKSTFKIDWKYFNVVTLFDDQGFLNESIEKYQSLKNEYSRSDYYSSDMYGTETRYFYQGLIAINRNEQQFKRRFLKIQDVIAVSINFVKTIAACCYLINLYVSTNSRTKKLIEKLFSCKPQHVEQSVEVKVNTVTSKVQLTPIIRQEEKVGWIESLICCWRQKAISQNYKEFKKQAERYISNCFEVVSIVRLFKNFEKLKELALSEEEKQELEELNKMDDHIVN